MIKKILLAEDDRGTALLVKTQLGRYGYSVRVANNGKEALNILKEERVDLIVTDVVMPEMDGVDLYQAIKGDKYLADIPVIIVTDKETFLNAFSVLGVSHFLPKTSDIRALVDKIKKIESVLPAKRNLFKVLLCGENNEILDQMKGLLQDNEYLVAVTDNPLEAIAKAVEMTPHFVILDALMKKHVSAPEFVRALRVFHSLRKVVIFSYVDFDPEVLGAQSGMMDRLKEALGAILDAGADKYIGRFNRVTFLDQIREMKKIGAQ